MGIGAQPVQQPLRQQTPPLAEEGRLQRPPVARQQRQQLGQFRRVPQAVHIGLAEADVAAGERCVEHPPVMHLEFDAVLARTDLQVLAIGQAEVDAPAFESFQ